MVRQAQTSDRKHLRSSPSRIEIELLEARQLFSGALTGSFAGAIPAILRPGATNHVNVRLTNTSGGADAGAVTVSLYVSPTPDAGGDAVIVGTVSRAVRMRTGKSVNVPFRFASPTLPNGTDYLVAKIDGPASSDGSPNESIVVAPQSVAVMRPVVNLSGQVEAPFTPLYARPFGASRGRVQVLITNSGNVPARGPMQVTVYASTDGTLDASDTVIGVATFRAAVVRPGAFRPFAVPIHVPAPAAVGSYTLFASINSAQTISATVATGARPLVVTNPPVVIDRRGHHGDGSDDGSDLAVVTGIDAGSYFYDTGDDSGAPVDTSGNDTSAPPPDTGDSNPTTAPTDSGGSTDTSGDNGSDFSGDSGDDSGGGIDF
jgi:hypothetical protein